MYVLAALFFTDFISPAPCKISCTLLDFSLNFPNAIVKSQKTKNQKQQNSKQQTPQKGGKRNIY